MHALAIFRRYEKNNSLAEPFVSALIGKNVSHVWRGHGSALFLEFGELSVRKRAGRKLTEHPEGELTLMVQWSWRIERARSIITGSWGEEKSWPSAFARLTGASVTRRILRCNS